MKKSERALASTLGILLLGLSVFLYRAYVVDTSSCVAAELQWGLFCDQAG